MIQHEFSLTLADGFELTRWESYELETDYRELPSTTWRATFGPAFHDEVQEIKARVQENPVLTARLDSVLLATGRVMAVETTYDDQGSYLNLSGSDAIAQKLKDVLPLGFRYLADGTVIDLLRAALTPKGIEIVTSNTANLRRLTGRRTRNQLDVDRAEPVGVSTETLWAEDEYHPSAKQREMQPRPTERVSAWIQRVCETENLVCWVQADGKLFVGRPSYETHLAGRLVSSDLLESPAEGVIKTATLLWRPGDQFTRVTACGRVNHAGDSTVEYTAIDEELEALGYYCEERIVDSDLHDQEEAKAVATRQLRAEQLKTYELHATVVGYGVGRQLLAPGLMVRVADTHLGVRARLYCPSRKFKLSPAEGGAETSELVFVRPKLWGMAA